MKDKDDGELLYTIKVNIEEIYAKATQICHEAKKKSANIQNVLRQTQGRYAKMQGTDKDMESALNVISCILAGLNGRRVELAAYIEKISKPETMKKELSWVFDELKNEKVNKKLLSLLKQDSPPSFEQPLPKYDTLYDFVNEDSVKRLVADAGSSYQQLESLNYTLGISFAFLIESIEKPIEELTLASGVITSSYNILKEHYKKMAESLTVVENLLAAIREQHERIRKIFSFRVLNKGNPEPLQMSADKEFKPEVENPVLTVNNENLHSIDKLLGEIKTSDDIVAQEYEYYDQYAKKKVEAYQNLMNVPQKAKSELGAIEEKFKEFENCWADTHQRFSEIESLVHWYKQFKRSYHGLFVELQRRIKVEKETEQEVEGYRKRLLARFEEEVQQRNKFNTTAIKYLPPAFHPLLTINPVKYEIFPTQNISPLAKLSATDEELFSIINIESASLQGSLMDQSRLPASRKSTI